MSRIFRSNPRERASFITAADMFSACTKFSKFVHWLPTWKLSPSTTSPAACASSMSATASPGSQPNFDDSSTIDPVFGTRRRSSSPACGAHSLIFPISIRLSNVTSGLYLSRASSVSFALTGFA